MNELIIADNPMLVTTIPAEAGGLKRLLWRDELFDNEHIDKFIEFIQCSKRTEKAYIVNLRQFYVWLRYMEIEYPAQRDIYAFRQWLESDHESIELDTGSPMGWRYRLNKEKNKINLKCSSTTVAAYMHTVKEYFAWAAEMGYYPNVALRAKTPKVETEQSHRKKAFLPTEVRDIERQMDADADERMEEVSRIEDEAYRQLREQRTTEQGKRLYAMFLLAITVGLRTIELERADVRDVVTSHGQTVICIQGKGRTFKEEKPVAPEVKEALDDYLRSRKDGAPPNAALFVATGNRSGGQRLRSTTISRMLKQAMRSAGYNESTYTAHSLRHTAGTTVQSLTNDIYQTQRYMRHNDPKTTEIYLHDAEMHKDAELAKRLYHRYHGDDKTDDYRTRLRNAIDRMNEEQLRQIEAYIIMMWADMLPEQAQQIVMKGMEDKG